MDANHGRDNPFNHSASPIGPCRKNHGAHPVDSTHGGQHGTRRGRAQPPTFPAAKRYRRAITLRHRWLRSGCCQPFSMGDGHRRRSRAWGNAGGACGTLPRRSNRHPGGCHTFWATNFYPMRRYSCRNPGSYWGNKRKNINNKVPNLLVVRRLLTCL